MPQLDPTWFASQVFWLFVCFVALYFMLSKLVLPPLLDIMARRTDMLATDIDTAQRLKGEAEQARQDYEKVLAQSRAAAQAQMNAAVAEQKAKAEAKGKELEAQIEQKLAAAQQQIEAKKAAMMKELGPAVEELTSLIVEKLTNAKPSASDVGQVLKVAKGGR